MPFLFCLFSVSSPCSASLVDPRYRFRTIHTEHFDIHFHQGEAALAARLSGIAEATWLVLEARLAPVPPGKTQVVIVDQNEQANGWATPLPYDTIVIYATWPPTYDFNTDDGLRLLFVHEFTHIVHLDRSVGWARVIRDVLGRSPIAFPNLYLPIWQIEGLATFEESSITGGGRLHAGEFRAIVDEAARTNHLEPIDRVNGGLIDWPSGNAAYAYGLRFHAYLAERFGLQTFAQLGDATAGRFLYAASPAFKQVYGESLGQLWQEFERDVAKAAEATPERDPTTRLTHHRYQVRGPRFVKPACAGCPLEVVYSLLTQNDFPSLNSVKLDGSKPRELTTRALGATTAVGRTSMYFDQQDLARSTGQYADLYELERASGNVRRLTTEARLLDPDLSPDEQTLVCVQDGPMQRNLVLVHLKPALRVETLVEEPETQFNAPRWSPDGKSIAVQRQRLHGAPEIVVLDVTSRAVRVVGSGADLRFMTAAWTPDGTSIVAAMARGDDVFNLVEIPAGGTGPIRQLTHFTGGAAWPDVSPDGRTIVFVGYTWEGYELYTIPYPVNASPVDITPAAPLDGTSASSTAATAGSPYSPWGTLRPTSWSPLLTGDSSELRIGAEVTGYDLLQYHAYAAAVTWLARGPSDSTQSRAVPDWQVSYEYLRWVPHLFAAASAMTSFFNGPPTASGLATTGTERQRQLQTGLVVPFLHVRYANSVLASMVFENDEFLLPGGTTTRNRNAFRAAWSTINAKIYGYSISPEDGVAIGVTTELVRRNLGAAGDATVSTADARFYVPSFLPHHVIAVRLAGGLSDGDFASGRAFLLGGPGPNASPVDFSDSAISLMRGFPADTFAGTRVALLNADYRFPLTWLQRGAGTWPAFLKAFHAAVFSDVGTAWTKTFSTRNLKTSAGAELSLDVVAGFFFPFTLTFGGAWGHDGSGAVADGASAYFRLGRAF